MGFHYSDRDICYLFNNAECKEAQIKVLAELNAVSQPKMAEKLFQLELITEDKMLAVKKRWGYRLFYKNIAE